MPLDRKHLLREIQRVAREKKVRNLSRSQFSAATGISPNQIYQHFDGWRQACHLAGLEPYEKNIKLESELLFKEMLRVFNRHAGLCTRTKFNKLSRYSVDTFKNRFGSWTLILAAFRQWLETNDIEFPYIKELPLTVATKPTEQSKRGESQVVNSPKWQSLGGTTYGALLNFRGLQHAPVNEQGVVFLFGMVCSELGFMVEGIRTGFPDCEGKRCVDRKGDRWEKVRIEFEFQSSNFKAQGHRPEGCDILVCWEHDWPDCPLQVLELKSAIRTLKAVA